jgi:hypothetical protein
MATKPHSWRVWGRGAVAAGAIAALAPACALLGTESVCLTYACGNQARLEGEVAVAGDTGLVGVKYCSAVECVEGKLDLSQLGSEQSCVEGIGASFGSDVCFTRDGAGKLQVAASLTREDDMKLPPDGERYTLTIVDEASGDTLLQETREADYVTTREDDCHLCWQAEMSL